jgi:hypothetical protein
MPDVVQLGERRELFVDESLIAEMRGTRLQLSRPERREVAFTFDAPWEDNVAFPLSVFTDRDSVRLVYRAAIPDLTREHEGIAALAESTDGGRTFHRPDLGLVEFAGSKRNNILAIGGPPGVPPAFLDINPNCKPEERYKGLASKWQELYAMCSADGLRWRPMLPQPIEMKGTFDTVNTAFWDSLHGCYRCFTRFFADVPPDGGDAGESETRPAAVRAIQSSTSADFINWTPPVPHQYNDQEQLTQLYTNSTLPCPGAEHVYVAFPNRFVEQRVGNPDHPHTGVNDALFMASRDCIHWTRYLEAWVRPGLDHRNWTERNNYPVWGIVETSPQEWSMYISEHYRQADAPGRLRRLSIRPHGFVSVHAGYDGGEMVTKSFTFSGREMRLNYSTSAAGSVRVEIEDEGGRPVAGHRLTDMQPLFGDELDRTVAWNGGSDLSRLIGKPVRLRFVLKDADIFAFRTVNRP